LCKPLGYLCVHLRYFIQRAVTPHILYVTLYVPEI
jgi:hypothetical protein